MTPAELIAAFRAALDAEEKTAHSAAAVCGCHPEVPSWSFGDEQTDGRIVVNGEPHPKVRRRIGRRWNGSYEGMFMAQHIVRHSPEFVLADIAAKRAVIDACERVDGLADDYSASVLANTTLRLLAEAYGIRTEGDPT